MADRSDTGASAEADQALVASDEAGSRLHPSGFDPSRDDMVFRVAKAIARANVLAAEPETGCLSDAGINQLVEYFSTKCIPEARAAIAAMRDPAPRMVAAALPLFQAPTEEQRAIGRAALALLPPVRIEQHYQGEQAAADLVRDWQTMIDAAAIATEARRAETENTGSVHEGADPEGIAQTGPSPNPDRQSDRRRG